MSKKMVFLLAVVLAMALLRAGQVFADYNVTISAAASSGGSWSGASPDVWTPSGTGSNVSVADIQSRLIAGTNVTITTAGGGSESGDIIVNAPFSWGTGTLTLTAGRDVSIGAVMTARRTSVLIMNTAQSAAGGTVRVAFKPGVANGFAGKVDFPGRTGVGALTINGVSYSLINNVTDLQAIGLAGNYALGDNIDAFATSDWNSSAGFQPIGNDTTQFSGVFEGLGHIVSGLHIERPSQNYVGLFGYTNGAAIRNVGRDFDQTARMNGRVCVGGLVGINWGGSISNSYSTGSVTGGDLVGGLVGWNESGSISYSYSTGSVTGGANVGGLVGWNDYGSISNSYSTGSATGTRSDSYVGGLVGYNYGGSISYSYSTGSVTGGANVGGLVGWNDYCSISNSYSTGSVTGTGSTSYAGGLVGYAGGGSINNSYSTGSVTATGRDSIVGGLVGCAGGGSINNSYSTGSVTATDSDSYVGGLVGYAGGGSINNSFWDTQTSGQSSSAGGGTGKTNAQMMQYATFQGAGWDISSSGGSSAVWRIYEGRTYPLLRGLLTPLTATANNDVMLYDGITAYSAGAGVTCTPSGYIPGKVAGALGYSGDSQGATAVGTYTITPGGLYSVQQGYDISFVSGTLSILTSLPVTHAGAITTSILIDPNSPITLYAGLDGAGVYKSTDNTNWNQANGASPNNLKNLRVKALARAMAGSIYAATYGGGVFKTADGGGNWKACDTTNMTNLNVISLALDAGGKLYAGTEAGVFVSNDSCANWTAMNNGLPTP